jgi:DNA/RNA endonuclease YhcR with UshA esterase domain
MKYEDSIAVSILKGKIVSLEGTIKRYQGDENIGVRIQAQSKIVMLEQLIKDIEHAVKQL